MNPKKRKSDEDLPTTSDGIKKRRVNSRCALTTYEF